MIVPSPRQSSPRACLSVCNRALQPPARKLCGGHRYVRLYTIVLTRWPTPPHAASLLGMMSPKKTIMVVEDDDSRRKALVALLSGAGYDVIAGEDFQSALHMVDRLGVDVMISDLQLSAASARPTAAHATQPKQ